MICIDGSAARICAWSDWSEIAYLPLCIDTKGLQLTSVNLYTSSHKQLILLELSELDGSANTRALHLLDAASFSVTTDSTMKGVTEAASVKKEANKISIEKEVVDAIVFSPLLYPLAHCISHVVGLRETGKLIFLDIHSWVCSVDLESLGKSSISYVRHFFVPYDWLSGTRDVICAILRRNVLFTRNDDVVIIKGGLEHVEMVEEIHAELEAAEMKGPC